jgi:hypothetical protein
MSSTQGSQDDWRWCPKCSGMVYWGSAPCAAGGVHDFSQSGNYSLPHDSSNLADSQSEWKYCINCQALSFTGGATIGPCPHGGAHVTAGSYDYDLVHAAPATGKTGVQDGWWYCTKCQALFWADDPAGPGPCQAGGTHAAVSTGYDYRLDVDVAVAGEQSQWRWCRRCNQLAYEGAAQCAGGGVHFNNGSATYTISQDDSRVAGQDGWKWCSKCNALIFAGGPSLGACPNGGTHDVGSSGAYILEHDIGAQPGLQGQWAYCNQCLMLWWIGGGPARCPAGPGIYHNGNGSYQYFLQSQPISSTAPIPIPNSTAVVSPAGPQKVDNNTSLSGGAIAGIVIGVLLVCAAAISILMIIRRRGRKKVTLPEAQSVVFGDQSGGAELSPRGKSDIPEPYGGLLNNRRSEMVELE